MGAEQQPAYSVGGGARAVEFRMAPTLFHRVFAFIDGLPESLEWLLVAVLLCLSGALSALLWRRIKRMFRD